MVHVRYADQKPRFPIVERAVADFPFLSSSELSNSIDNALNEALEDSRTGVKRQKLGGPAFVETSQDPLTSPSVSVPASMSRT
jgi:hypothetical protein